MFHREIQSGCTIFEEKIENETDKEETEQKNWWAAISRQFSRNLFSISTHRVRIFILAKKNDTLS